MIKHIVVFKLKDFANGKSKADNAEELKIRLLGLKDKIQEILEIEVGIKSDKAPDTNYDLILTTKFNGFDELDIYRVHPEHRKVVEFIGEITDDRIAIDFDI
ncbi:MAG: Dabb family protein [Melioribacteraceae bacterium]|nr:Dabb family protein [Melioribacteraceae bacterium]